MPNAAPISQPSYPASPAWRCSPPPPTTWRLFRGGEGAPENLDGIPLPAFRDRRARDCSNYYGLDGGTWFRAAVRFPEEHHRLAQAHCGK